MPQYFHLVTVGFHNDLENVVRWLMIRPTKNNARRTDRASAPSRLCLGFASATSHLRLDYALAPISCEHCRSSRNSPHCAPRHLIYYCSQDWVSCWWSAFFQILYCYVTSRIGGGYILRDLLSFLEWFEGCHTQCDLKISELLI